MLIVHLVSSDRTKWSHVHTHLIFPVTVEKNITIIVHLINEEQGFPVGSVVKNLPGLQIVECRRPSVRLWVRKVPRRREWQPTPVFLPGEFHGQSSLMGYSPGGRKNSDTTEETYQTCIHEEQRVPWHSNKEAKNKYGANSLAGF